MTPDRLRSRLMTYLSSHSPEHSARSRGPFVALRGGWASSLYTFTVQRAGVGDASATTLVLKMYAPTTRGLEHATRERHALTRLRDVGYPVPRVVLSEPDARHLERPFITMNYIPGASFWRVFEAADPVTQDQLTRSFVTPLVRLHALDPKLLEPAATLIHPHQYIEQELEQLRRNTAVAPHTMLAEVVRWLDQRGMAVPCEQPVILHRDYHPWNVVVGAGDQLWVLDWDWRIGDARDLAWTCTLMQRSGFHRFSDAVRDEYAHQSGRALDELAYFEVLTTVRWLLNVLAAPESDGSLDAEVSADFRSFLVGPVRAAKTLLQGYTGIDVDLTV